MPQHRDCIEHLKQEGRPESVSFEPKLYRDVIWCPYLNEPAILSFEGDGDDRHPVCVNCNGNYEASSHPFICHIGKP